jgi:hypothetical protein
LSRSAGEFSDEFQFGVGEGRHEGFNLQ